MNKNGTVTNLQQGDHPCPTGFRWEFSTTEVSRPNFKAKVDEWISSLLPDTYATTFNDPHIAVTAKSLTDVPVLLAWSTRHVLRTLSPPTLTYFTGPWSKENRMTVVESFFQTISLFPFAQFSHPHKHKGPVPPTEIQRLSVEEEAQ